MNQTARYKYVDLMLHCSVQQGYGTMAVIGKNPAHTDLNSKTLRRVADAAEWFKLEPIMLNVIARRGTPREVGAALKLDYTGTVGPYNDSELSEAWDVDLVVAAWGQPSGIDQHLYRRRVDEVMELIGRDRFVCFGRTNEGFPLHPRRWPAPDKLRVEEYTP